MERLVLTAAAQLSLRGLRTRENRHNSGHYFERVRTVWKTSRNQDDGKTVIHRSEA